MTRPIGTAAELERRRRRAVLLVDQGESPSTVARILGVHETSVHRWRRLARRPHGLDAQPLPGPTPRLSDYHLHKLERFLLQGAHKHGWPNHLWTAGRVATLIRRRFGVDYHPEHVRKILKQRLGWTSQKPQTKAREQNDKEVERDAALKGIMRWVRLHPYNISQKVQIVVEHFRENVAPLLEGRAKAMVVLGSRVEAVRWKLAIDKHIKSRGYMIGTLVAFSGEVNDKESGPDSFTENGKILNPNLTGRDIRDAFKGDDHQILLGQRF